MRRVVDRAMVCSTPEVTMDRIPRSRENRTTGRDRPRISRRALLRAGVVGGAGLALGPGLASCAGPTGTSSERTLTLALNRSLVSLDNKLNQFDAHVTVQRAVRQALTRIGADLRPVPVLAEHFELAEPTRWNVRLHPDAAYSDGSPVTVDDVATALEMYQQVDASFVGAQFPEWPRVDKHDERTFDLVTEQPVVGLDSLMSNILISPAADNLPEELSEGVGSGPYTVVERNRGTGDYSLRADPAYWGPAPGVDRVDIRFLPEETSRVLALRSGEVDIIDSISPDSAEQLDGLPGIAMLRAEGTRMVQLFYNFRKPPSHPLSSPAVREALSLAVDGHSIARDVLLGSVTEAEGVVPLTLDGAVAVGRYEFDPDRARQMLDAHGVDDLELIIIWESGEFTADAYVMEAVAEMLGDIGVRVRLRQFEPGGDIATWRQGRGGDWDIIGNGYGNQTGLALTSLQGMYAGTPEMEETGDAFMGYVYDDIAAAIGRASAETDDERRAALLEELQRAVWDTWPSMWAFGQDVLLAHRSRVSGVDLLAINSYDLADVRLEEE